MSCIGILRRYLVHSLMEQMACLPRPPGDFSARCKDLRSGCAEPGALARTLAGHMLDTVQFAALTRAIKGRAAAGHTLAPLVPFRIGILASATINVLCDCLP